MANERPVKNVSDKEDTEENISNELLKALRICNLADSYFKNSDYENALDSYHVALRTIQLNAGKSHIYNCRAMKGMGVVHYHMGNDDKAYYCLSSAMDLLKKNGEKNSLSSAEIYDLLGDIHRRRGELRKAQTSYRKSIKIMQQVSRGVSKSSTHELTQIMSRITHKRGLVHQERGQSKKAMRRFEESQDILLKETDGSARREFMMTNLPKLKSIISSQSSVEQCINQLDFFSEIPSICERLRDELNFTQETEDKWKTLKSVCTEHVGLEILLIEAVSGFKMKINEQMNPREKRKNAMSKRFSMVVLERKGKPHTNCNDQVKTFITPYIRIVWDLGELIAERILKATKSPFELAFNDPVSMKAITEAVDVYDVAANQYEDFYGQSEREGFDAERLHFTDIRTELVARIYKDCEHRSSTAFTSMDIDQFNSESDAGIQKVIFRAVLRTCKKLTEEIEPIKKCFPHYWAVDVQWGACVAYQCSHQVKQQIGGINGRHLPNFTITQLLQLISWVERYHEVMAQTFPDITSKLYTDMHYDSYQHHRDIGPGSDDEEDINDGNEQIVESLVWSNNMLWEVQRLAQEEFLVRTQDTTDEFLTNVYSTEPVKIKTKDGRRMTTLCEDLFSLANLEIQTLQENLRHQSDLFIMSVNIIFSRMHLKQIQYRDTFLQDFESCCAAANDFINMSEQMEEVTSRLLNDCELSERSATLLKEISAELIVLYGNDAIYAAQSVHVHVFEPIRNAIADDLFGWEWEDKLTRNELALTLVRTVDDFMVDLGKCMDDFLLKKTLDALVPASTMFYLRCLLRKAVMRRGLGVSQFHDNAKALRRISGDIEAMREYFDTFVHALPALKRVIKTEFGILTAVHDIMSAANDCSCGDAFDPILVLHKQLLDISKTKQLVKDLWSLVNPTHEEKLKKFLKLVEPKLRKITSKHTKASAGSLEDRPKILGLKLDEIVANVTDDDGALGWQQRMRYEVQNVCGCAPHAKRGCNCTTMCVNPKEIMDIMYSIPAK